MTRLGEIATVSAGANFRARIPISASGKVRVIQTKDLGDGLVHLNKVVRVNLPSPKLGCLMRAGDIIFRSRGQPHTAALLTKNAKDTIVGAPLLLVRANADKVLPEYLLWCINQPSSQSSLASAARGTSVKMIGKQALEDLEVNLPPLAEQSKVAKIISLSNREQQLLEKMKKLRALHIHGILTQMTSQPHQSASSKQASST
ncbi:MAG: restriction endonuclease subunit S [Pseudomonadales bacterium]